MTPRRTFVHGTARTIHECRSASAYSRPLARTVLQAFADAGVDRDLLAHNIAATFSSLPAALNTLSPASAGTQLYNRSYGVSILKPAVRALRQFRDRQPVVHLGMVACSASKHNFDEPVAARDLYASGYWTCKARFGDAVFNDWRIASAKHALLAPDAAIAHYDRRVDDLEGVPVESDRELPTGEPATTLLDQWAVRVHDGLRAWIRRAAGSTVAPRDVQLGVVLGQDYEAVLTDRGVFNLADVTDATVAVRFPWRTAGLSGNGEQMRWLNAEAGVGEAAPSAPPVAADGGEADD